LERFSFSSLPIQLSKTTYLSACGQNGTSSGPPVGGDSLVPWYSSCPLLVLSHRVGLSLQIGRCRRPATHWSLEDAVTMFDILQQLLVSRKSVRVNNRIHSSLKLLCPFHQKHTALCNNCGFLPVFVEAATIVFVFFIIGSIKT
jgi:hypothetical protein